MVINAKEKKIREEEYFYVRREGVCVCVCVYIYIHYIYVYILIERYKIHTTYYPFDMKMLI